jgi:hypothetical protein
MIINWKNVDLTRYAKDCLIDSLTFENFLQEISSNLPEITEKTVTAQFEEDLRWIELDARAIFKANLKNIVEFANKERKID